MKISHNYSPQRMTFLRSRGVDSTSILRRNESFELEDYCCKIVTDIQGMRPKSVSIASQLKGLEKLFENPLRSNYVLAISSWPSDLRAKQVGLALMSKAISYQRDTKNKVLKVRRAPLWYRIYGGFECGLRDKIDEVFPSMLILSNITSNSTNSKLEKVRDLLEKYAEIPRVVIIGGHCDPLSWFAKNLFYPVRMGLFLGPESKRREIVL
jgi:hypothetical protein